MLARRGMMGVGTRRFRFGPNKGGRWRPAEVVRCSNGGPRWRRWARLAGNQAARDTHGPGEREFAGMFDCPEGRCLWGRASQAGNGIARSRARARLNWVSQGQRWGRCRVRRRAERVSRPAMEKKRRRRVLVVTSCSSRPMRAAQRARAPSPRLPTRRRWRRNGPTGDDSTPRRT